MKVFVLLFLESDVLTRSCLGILFAMSSGFIMLVILGVNWDKIGRYHSLLLAGICMMPRPTGVYVLLSAGRSRIIHGSVEEYSLYEKNRSLLFIVVTWDPSSRCPQPLMMGSSVSRAT